MLPTGTLRKKETGHMTNPFTQHARASGGGGSARNSTFLKFSRGDYIVSRDGRVLENGMRLIANMAAYSYGFVCWSGNRPVDQRMVTIAGGESRPWRCELGRDDQSMWEKRDGKVEDPWRETETIELADPKTSEVFLFSTSSIGGIGALRELSDAYGDALDQHEGDWPIIAIEVRTWESERYGRQKSPSFPIVGWMEKGASGILAPPPASQPALPPLKSRSEEFDDEVPF